MGRLHQQTLDRAEAYADRTLDVVEALEKQRRSRRIIDQLAGAGTSVGANVFEADEAMTAKDFAKSLGIVAKELNECRFWLRLIGRRGWIPAERLGTLLQETEELKAMFGSMVVRTHRTLARTRSKSQPHRSHN